MSQRESRFRIIRRSEPKYETDHLKFITVKSPALRARADITVFIPPDCEQAAPLPIALLLHGAHGSHWHWAYRAGAHKTALAMIAEHHIRPIALVMPSDGLWGDGSGYLPHHSANYERWIMSDVIDCVRETFSCLENRSPLFIAGLSMGGYGALRLGAKYAEQFSGISVHSSITHFDQLKLFVEEPLESYGQQSEEDKSVLHHLIKNKNVLPPLHMDCGSNDLLVEHNRKLHQDLSDHGVRHEYVEFPGDHSWSYWEEHFRDTLAFFEQC